MPGWTVDEPTTLSFDGDPLTDVRVRVVGGTVNVVGTDGPARLEVTEVDGPPLRVDREGGTLTVGYEDLSWSAALNWLDRSRWRRHAAVSLAVPWDTRVEVGTVTAPAVVGGLRGTVAVRSVGGPLTLTRLSGRVEAQTVTAEITAHGVTGALKAHTVSGPLTVTDAGGSRIGANSVSGSMVMDLEDTADTELTLHSVSGEVTIRLPHTGDAQVEAGSASGRLSSAFDELRMDNHRGAKRLSGRLGRGGGRLRASTVSGSVTLLRRPPGEPDDAPHERKELA
ncbi:DUF4097 family beta strand repeat-containing protein [Allostreptomyces psammosilenae]|uniref:DUF4097 domain-containing protein n=1 Tax=Allostreptomyces psammosilenae TaxID=1892865 RepID=A0A853A6M6_9ACTN|nr:DUF4097 family beta strand repeat-containing protein [Allostreptomyces psammosilenae]NYI06331.1 hypothetical protein [Allostreptomyces psammosilenae]